MSDGYTPLTKEEEHEISTEYADKAMAHASDLMEWARQRCLYGDMLHRVLGIVGNAYSRR